MHSERLEQLSLTLDQNNDIFMPITKLWNNQYRTNIMEAYYNIKQKQNKESETKNFSNIKKSNRWRRLSIRLLKSSNNSLVDTKFKENSEENNYKSIFGIKEFENKREYESNLSLPKISSNYNRYLETPTKNSYSKNFRYNKEKFNKKKEENIFYTNLKRKKSKNDYYPEIDSFTDKKDSIFCKEFRRNRNRNDKKNSLRLNISTNVLSKFSQQNKDYKRKKKKNIKDYRSKSQPDSFKNYEKINQILKNCRNFNKNINDDYKKLGFGDLNDDIKLSKPYKILKNKLTPLQNFIKSKKNKKRTFRRLEPVLKYEIKSLQKKREATLL